MGTYIVEFGSGAERWVNAGWHREAASLALDGFPNPFPDSVAVLGPDDREPQVIPTAEVRRGGL